jgi:hypothetical protein
VLCVHVFFVRTFIFERLRHVSACARHFANCARSRLTLFNSLVADEQALDQAIGCSLLCSQIRALVRVDTY